MCSNDELKFGEDERRRTREESLKGDGGWREGRVNEVGITKDEG